MMQSGKRKRSNDTRNRKRLKKSQIADERAGKPSRRQQQESNQTKRSENGGEAEGPSKSNSQISLFKPKSSSFLDKMKSRLRGGHFRMINEKLYTCSGNEALNFFKKDPTLFNVYHAGYQEQMSRWPELPLNIIIKWLKNHNSSLVVADFGCGDARLAISVENRVFSIDLVSNDPSVIACDMSNTPLDTSSVDVAVFCLSLMGTNFPSYLLEAHRVLKRSGCLFIEEVRSRFDPNNGGADPDKFSKAVQELGFSPTSKDFSNKMFVLFFFKKMLQQEQKSRDRKKIEWPELKACIYKRR